MALNEKFIVIPFRRGHKGATVPGEIRVARNEEQAKLLAESIAKYCLGASAIAVLVDEYSGEMTSPRLIMELGKAINLIEDLAA